MTLGRPVRAEQVALADLTPERRGLADPYSAEGFRRLCNYYDRHGFHGGNSLVLRAILGRAPATFDGFWRAEQVRRVELSTA